MRFSNLFFVCCLPVVLSAQTAPWSIGITGGNTFSELQPDPQLFDDPMGTGSHFGIRVAHYLSEHWALQANALYEKKGYDWAESFTDANGNEIREDHENYVDYLVIPVTIQWRLGKGHLHYGPLAGAYGAFWLNQKNVRVSGLEQTEYPLRKADWGATAGLGVEYLFNKLSVNLEGRYNLGLANVAESPFSDASFRSFAWLLGINYNFGEAKGD